MRSSYIWWMIYREIITALSILNFFPPLILWFWFVWMNLIELNLWFAEKHQQQQTTTIETKRRHSNQNDDFWKRFYLILFYFLYYSFVHFGVHLLVYTHAYKRRSLIYTWTAIQTRSIESLVCVGLRVSLWEEKSALYVYVCTCVRAWVYMCATVYVHECVCVWVAVYLDGEIDR